MPDIGHAYLSASASDRWTHCPPSANLNAEATERASLYAMEGTCAHSLCEYLVLIALGRDCKAPTEHLDYYDSEIMTTRQTGGLLAPIRGSYQPASKDAGFHYVQARLLLTRHRP